MLFLDERKLSAEMFRTCESCILTRSYFVAVLTPGGLIVVTLLATVTKKKIYGARNSNETRTTSIFSGYLWY